MTADTNANASPEDRQAIPDGAAAAYDEAGSADNELQCRADYIREATKAEESDRRMVRTIVDFLFPVIMVQEERDRPPHAVSRDVPEDDDETISARNLARTAAYRRLRRIFDGDLDNPELRLVRSDAKRAAAEMPLDDGE